MIKILNLSRLLTLLIPWIFIYVIFKKQISNNDYNKDSKALIIFKKFEDHVIENIKIWLCEFYEFLSNHKFYIKIIIFIWLFNFQFLTIFIEFIAYYLYFIVSIDFISIYIQVIKLLMDLSIIIDFIPLILWLLIGYLILHSFRKKIGFNNLNHMDARNGGMVEERSKVVFIDGTMGKGKTKELTDMALTMEVKMRKNAFKKILECDLKFPNFPWITFERFLKKEIKKKNLYNLASIKKCINVMANRFFENPSPGRIFQYDYEKYGLYYNDNLEIKNIWDILEDYAKLYFVYIIKSSLILSNFTIPLADVRSSVFSFFSKP